MLTEDQIAVIETASDAFNGRVIDLWHGVRQYLRLQREARGDTRFVGISQLQRVSQSAFDKIMATVPKVLQDEVNDLIEANAGQPIPVIKSVKVSESIASGTISLNTPVKTKL